MSIGVSASKSNSDIESLLSDLDINYRVVGSRSNSNSIKNVAAIDEATSDDLTFCSSNDERGLNNISKSNAGVILCDSTAGTSISPKAQQLFILVSNPRLTFMHLANRMYGSRIRRRLAISHLSYISSSSQIGENCSIGNYSVIDEGCIIGKNTIIGHRVSIQNCVVGANRIIQSGVSIGEDGFAYERNELLELEPFPHFGKVIIGNNVEISTNCSIARGSLKDTIIGDGTKLDALVHIAHNVNVAKNCSLTAGTVIGRSTIVGDTSWLGLNSTLKHKIKLGKKVIVGSGASVINDVPDEDIVAGVPAKSIKHKVTSGQLFLMAGQKNKSTSDVENKKNLLHY